MTEALGPNPTGPNDRVDAEVDSFLRESAMVGTSAPSAAEPPADLTPWGRSKMSQAEWSRALQSSDAQLKGATPGSEEFARLMEARLRMNMPPPTDLAFEDIERYAKAQVRSVMQDELASASDKPRGTEWLRVVVGVLAVAFLVTSGVLVSVILKKSDADGASAEGDDAPEPPAAAGPRARPDGSAHETGSPTDPQVEPQNAPQNEPQGQGEPGANRAPATSASQAVSTPLSSAPRLRPKSKTPRVEKPFFE